MSQQAKRTNAALLVLWSEPKELFEPPLRLQRSRGASRSKDVVKLGEDELHRLVLVNHIHRHVAIVPLGAHQSRPEDDADVLGGHSVVV